MNKYKIPDKNRISAVFNHEIPDRVPNFEVLVEGPALEHIMGRRIEGSTLTNIDPYLYVEFVNKIGQDVIGMNFYDNPFRYADSCGNKKKLDFKISSPEDLDIILPTSLEHLEDRFALLDKYQEAVKGTGIGLFVLTGDFFCTAFDSIFGFENFMYLLNDEPDLIEEILERYARHYAQMAERLTGYDLTFFYAGDDIAFKSGTLINPEKMRKIWLPRMDRIMEPARKRGIPILYHSDGNIINLLPDLIDIGVSAINPVEPYGMDIRDVKRKFGRHLSIVGNLDAGGNLSMGTPDDVREEARRLIDDVGKDGGLVLASSHSITRNIKPDNFLAMIETAQTYGIYK